MQLGMHHSANNMHSKGEIKAKGCNSNARNLLQLQIHLHSL